MYPLRPTHLPRRDLVSRRNPRVLVGPTLVRLALVYLALTVAVQTQGRVGGGFTWRMEVVDGGGGSAGRHSSLAMASNGTLYVLYVDDASGLLKLATLAGQAWRISVVDGPRLFDGDTNVRVDPDGDLHVSYYDSLTGMVRYGIRAGGGGPWILTDVDRGLVEGYNQLAIDPLGGVHLAYVWDNGTLRYAVRSGSSWIRESLDSSVILARYVSLAVDGYGTPHLAYYGSGHLRYTRLQGIQWITEGVDAREGVGWFSRIGLDSFGRPHIAYYDSTDGSLRYATRVGSAWSFSVVDASGDAGWDPSLVVGPDNLPRITYYARIPADLRYAEVHSGSWSVQTIDDTGVVGWESSLAVSVDGAPRVTYYDWTHGFLKYAAGASVLGVRTVGVSSVAGTSALLSGEVTSLGPFSFANASFEWRPAGGASWLRTEVVTVQTAGPYSFGVNGLSPGARYEFRGVITANGSTATGAIVEFETQVPWVFDWTSTLLVATAAGISFVGIGATVFIWRRYRPPRPPDDKLRNGPA